MKKTAAKKGNPELIEALNAIEKEKDISKEILLEAIENSLVAACKNEYGKADNIRVNLDRETGEFHVYQDKVVVEEVEDAMLEMAERIKDLEEKFLNSKIDMIVSLDGGCTVIEMIDKVDYDMINKNKKIFTGFSDLTHLQIAMYTKSKLPSLYGMDIINGFGNNNEFTQKNINSFFNIINNKEEKIENYDKVKVLKEGNATGTLVGGWLTAIADLIETEYWPDDENVILFFEEVECEPHLININLQRIKLSKKMKNIKGIVIGDFTDCEEKEYWDCIPTIEDIILNTFKEYNIPIISNMSFGHGDKHLTIPIGIKAEINSEWNYIK